MILYSYKEITTLAYSSSIENSSFKHDDKVTRQKRVLRILADLNTWAAVSIALR